MRWPGKGMGWKEFFRAFSAAYKKDRLGDVAAALTYYAVLAIFPFLLFLVALASLIIDPNQARHLADQLGKVAPGPAAQILGERIESLASNKSGGLLTIGALGAIWSAAGGIVALMRSLNVVYDVEEGRSFWKVRLIALGATLVGAGLSLVAMLIALGLPAVASRVPQPFSALLMWLRLPVAGLLVMFTWALLYFVLPDVEQRFKLLTPGAVIGVVIWIGASLLFSVYVANFGKYEATYGAVGGVIVMLLWMYLSSQVLLIGAEINAVIEHASEEGKRPGAKSLRDRGAVPPEEQAAEKHGERGAPPPPRQPEPPYERPPA